MGGRVSMMFADFTTAMPHVQAGTLRALAVTRIKRSSLFPELPTMDEAASRASTSTPGPASSRQPSRRRRWSPSSTPRCARSSTARRCRPKFKNVGFEGFSSTPERARRFHQDPARRLGRKMVKDANIQAD